MPQGEFSLRFPERDLERWASRFPDREGDHRIAGSLRAAVRERGHLTRREFVEICAWKTPRSKPHCAKNTSRGIRTLTAAALATSDDRVKMDLLRLLEGVEWPTASTILHFCDERPYPILDVRAVWSLGFSRPPSYTMEFWLAYVAFTRGLAKRSGLSMRAVDQALWQYSKERQK
ncbi:MAG TPA: hypothetical protein VFP58_07735 [Candidatus Eisenbacteria bacterium]|nr:hypothetical protein [Candidatus Eisenbacteria bacterium]